MAGVDQPVKQRFSDDWVGEQVVPIFGRAVGRQDQRSAVDGAAADEFVEVVGLHGGVLAHREVVEDQDQRFGVFTDALTPGAISVAAGKVGEHAGGFGEADGPYPRVLDTLNPGMFLGEAR